MRLSLGWITFLSIIIILLCATVLVAFFCSKTISAESLVLGKKEWGKSQNRVEKPPFPKILLQVTKDKQPDYVIKMLHHQFGPHWEYWNVTDRECVEYMEKHPEPGFENIVRVFFSFTRGPHRADLFRYLFLYQKGGVFMDSDLMLYSPIETILEDQQQDFISIKTFHKGYQALFNGFLVVRPRHPILYQALQRLYHTSSLWLSLDYMYVCRDLYNIVFRHRHQFNITLYQEIHRPKKGYTEVVGPEGKVLFRHYYKTKKIPKSIEACYTPKRF